MKNNQPLFYSEHIDFTKEPLFLGTGRNVARLDLPIEQWVDKRSAMALGLTWFASDFSYQQDAKDFDTMSKINQELFLANLKFQTVLDSVATRTVAEVFFPCVTNPQLEKWFAIHTFQENIHSMSYADLIKALPINSTKVFDEIMITPEIQERVTQILEAFDNLNTMNAKKLLGTEDYNIEEHKKTIILGLVALNILEAGLFQTSFITTFAFGENNLMESSVKCMAKIKIDEENHRALTVYLINKLRKDNDWKYLFKEMKPQIEQMYSTANEADYMWIEYLFRDGARLLGLSEKVLKQYSDWNFNKTRASIGLSHTKDFVNPCTWANKYTNLSNQQNANNESDSAAYLLGKVNKHMTHEDWVSLGE